MDSRVLETKKINKFQVFNIESYLSGDEKSTGIMLEALGLERFEDLPADRYQAVLFILGAMSGIRQSYKDESYEGQPYED